MKCVGTSATTGEMLGLSPEAEGSPIIDHDAT